MIDYDKIIENDMELELYKEKKEEIIRYLETFGKKIFGI